MAVPLVRRYNSALAVVGVPVNATAAITGETTLQLSNDNVIEDFVNSPDTTAGRQPIGPIPISAQGGKQISYRSQADATVTALPYTYSFQIRYRNFF